MHGPVREIISIAGLTLKRDELHEDIVGSTRSGRLRVGLRRD
jgi:hypothetical protein